MSDTFERIAERFLNNTDPAYEECASGIAGLDKIIVNVSSRFSSTARGYLLPIVYAYWERFFRIVFSEYLHCIELSGINLISIHPQMARFRLRKELNSLLNSHRIKQIHEVASILNIEDAEKFFENLRVLFRNPVTFSDPTTWIETESNVNFNVLNDNCNNLGIDIEAIKKRLEESGIALFPVLKELVDARNQISHGQTFNKIDPKKWENLRNYILSIMTAVQLELFEMLRDGRYLKEAQP